MKSYFEILFQVEVFHNFFPVEEQHICNSLSFIPSDECLRTLANNRLLFKKTINGFAVIAEKKNIGTDALPNLVPFFSITPGTRFHFLISEPDDDFINITDSDPDLFAEGRKYFFRNSPTQPAVVAGNHATISLHNNTPLHTFLYPRCKSNVHFEGPALSLNECACFPGPALWNYR